MTCSVCHQRPPRPKIGPGTTPMLCAECYHARTHSRKATRLAVAASRIAARLERDDHAIRALPRAFCQCRQPVGKPEGPLLVCMVCAREITPKGEHQWSRI